MRITGIRLRQLTGTMEHPGVFWEERLVRPVDVYPEHKDEHEAFTPEPLEDGRYRMRAVFLEVDSDEGVTGLAGPITAAIAYIIDQQFRALLTGQDPTATERLWDKLYRHAIHGRKGDVMLAISTIDCALWDLRGNWLGQPVYRLLGGPVRTTIPAYASALGFSLEPDKVRERASAMVAEGYTAMKWFFRHGPTDGRAGIARNLALARTLRETAGPDIDIMLDAWSSWNVPYTVRMAERLLEYDPRWIEEPVLADQIAACAEIRRKSPVAIATGEHEYTRWGLKQLMDAGAADVLQPDIYWAGGISELVKICAIASTYDLPVVPHGHSVPATAHLIAAQPVTTCPIIEYLIKWNDVHQFFWREPLKPVNGFVTVPDRPGMGMELDPAKIEEERELTWR